MVVLALYSAFNPRYGVYVLPNDTHVRHEGYQFFFVYEFHLNRGALRPRYG